jgi:TonB family protein
MLAPERENRMKLRRYTLALLALVAIGLRAQDPESIGRMTHQVPDQDGVYYTGPEVTAPLMLRTVLALFPDSVYAKDVQGMTVMAMVIGVDGKPSHIQLLHSHGDLFDRNATAAVMHSTFEPGKLAGKSVPVWIDVRVVFRADHSDAIPQVVIAERDLPPPGEAQLEDKHHKPLSFTPPFPIHTVDADFSDPFVKHPFVQVAVVTVLVGEDGLPKDVRVRRGLGFGLDEKAAAAVQHYKFFPATEKGKPIAARRDVMVNFSKF